MIKRRSRVQKWKDFITAPLRAITLFEEDKWGLSSLRTERFDYVAQEVKGNCLDVGCGRNNVFIKNVLGGKGKGIDVYLFAGLTKKNIVEDMRHFPFASSTFDSITFIANINHIPKSMRHAEFKEAYRCLKPNGNIIVTMGNPLAEIFAHKVVHLYDILFHTNYDSDSERGMHLEEVYFLKDKEILQILNKAGFKHINKKPFLTQWGLNHLFVGWKGVA